MSEFAYQYNDWMTLEGAARLTRLRLHRSEVAALLVTDTSGADTSTSTVALQKYELNLAEQEEKLAAEVAARSHNPFQRVRRVWG